MHSLTRFAVWLIGARRVPGPVACPFASGFWLLAPSGMTGAAGHVYAGLHEFADMVLVLHGMCAGEELFVDNGVNIGSYMVRAAAGANCVDF